MHNSYTTYHVLCPSLSYNINHNRARALPYQPSPYLSPALGVHKKPNNLSAFPFLNQCQSCHFNGLAFVSFSLLFFFECILTATKFAYNAAFRGACSSALALAQCPKGKVRQPKRIRDSGFRFQKKEEVEEDKQVLLAFLSSASGLAICPTPNKFN